MSNSDINETDGIKRKDRSWDETQVNTDGKSAASLFGRSITNSPDNEEQIDGDVSPDEHFEKSAAIRADVMTSFHDSVGDGVAVEQDTVADLDSGSSSDGHQQYDVIDLTSDTDDPKESTYSQSRNSARYNLRQKKIGQDTLAGGKLAPAPERRRLRGKKSTAGQDSRYVKQTQVYKDRKNCNDDKDNGNGSSGDEVGPSTGPGKKPAAKPTSEQLSDTDEETSSDSEENSEDEDLDKKPAANNGLSAYEQLRLERIKRNNAKLVRSHCSFYFHHLILNDYVPASFSSGITWI